MTTHRDLTRPRPSAIRPLLLLISWVAVLALIAAGCADDDEDVAVTDPTVEDTAPTPDESEATPTVEEPTATPSVEEDETPTPEAATPEPTTTDDEAGIEIDVACVDGEPAVTATTPLPVSDIEEIDDIVNTIDFCEGVGGLASVSFTAPCPSGDREVIVAAVGGALPDIATLDLCENES